MNILGRTVVLRAIEESDLDLLHVWANDPEIWNLLGGWHFPGSRAYAQKWFEQLQSDVLNQRFAIQAPELGLIGTANLMAIDWKNNHAQHGIMIGDPRARGHGYGTDTVMAVMRYAFDELHMERLDGAIIEYNTTSYNLYCRKCGWTEEGRQRRWFYRHNRYWDQILVGITRVDYAELIKKNRYWDA